MEHAAYPQRCWEEAARAGVTWFGQHTAIDGEWRHFVEAGSGEPLVLIHGFLGWSFSWRHNLAALAAHARVLAPDLRNHGLSEKDARRPVGLDDQVEVLRAFLDARGVAQALLCGHSMGGEVALRFALRYPDRVKGLVLISSAGYKTIDGERPFARRLLRVPLLGPLLIRLLLTWRAICGPGLRRLYFDPSRVQPADIDGYRLPHLLPGAGAAMVRTLGDLDLGAYAARLPEVSQRTLLIWGENDPMCPFAHGQRMARELPHARLLAFARCGHMTPEEYPAEVNAAILSFLHELQEARA